MSTKWVERPLGEIITLKRGYDLPKRDRIDGPYPIVSSSGISGYHNKTKVKAPGVVTGRYGTLGQVFYLKDDFWPLNTSLYVQKFNGNAPRFVSYFLRTLRLGSQNAAGAVPGVNRNALHKLKVRIPPPQTQKKIAAILSAYDDLIENNNKRITLLEKAAEEIYREWFVRLRFPGWETTPFHKGIPEGWEAAPIESLCDEIRDGVKVQELDADTTYLGLEHLPRRSISINQSSTVESVQSNKLLFKDRDILFGKIRPYLHKIALAHFSGACSSDTIIVRPKNKILEGFLLFTIFSDTFVELATISAKGTKMPRADWDFLKKLEIVLPTTELLESYQDAFEAQFDLICKCRNQNKILKQSRDLLLSRLISGKLTVDELDIQFPSSMMPAEEPNHA